MNLVANQKFYLDEIPKTASFLRPEAFIKLPDLSRYMCMLDDRFTSLDEIKIDRKTSHFQEFLEVEDVQSNYEKSQYERVCGFSVFFLKKLTCFWEEDKERVSSETHQKRLESVREITQFDGRCPQTLLRFYVSPEVWDCLAKNSTLYAPGTEFYKMQHPSEDTQLGVIWRMLCLDDTVFEYAIQTDCETKAWCLDRFCYWSYDKYKNWIEPKGRQHYPWAGSYLIFIHNWGFKNELPEESGNPIWNPTNYDFVSGGGIMTRTEKMPSIQSVICQYISKRTQSITLYHADTDNYTVMANHFTPIPAGWEGFAFDQELWRLVKKVFPLRHYVYNTVGEEINNPDLPDDFMTKRLISQLISEGCEFWDEDKDRPFFNLI